MGGSPEGFDTRDLKEAKALLDELEYASWRIRTPARQPVPRW
jgi:hypothetical protein